MGRQTLRRTPKGTWKLQKMIRAAFLALPLNDEACMVYGVLSARLRSEGKRIGEIIEVIAAIALCHDRGIVTRDGHFREVAGLRVLGW